MNNAVETFSLLNFTNEYLVVFLLLLIGISIYKLEKNRVLDFILCVLLSGGLSEFIKYFVNSPRPVLTNGVSFEGSGFPSTHTTIAFAGFFFFLLCLNITHKHSHRLKNKIKDLVSRYVTHRVIVEKGIQSQTLKEWEREALFRIFFLIVAIFVAFLRVYTGAHYLIDVVGGIFLGFVSVLPFMFYDLSSRRIR